MTLHEEVEALRSIPLFAKIDASKLKLLAFTSERLNYEPGQNLFKQGDPGTRRTSSWRARRTSSSTRPPASWWWPT